MHVSSFEWENFYWSKREKAFHLTWKRRRCLRTRTCFQILPIIVRSNRLVQSGHSFFFPSAVVLAAALQHTATYVMGCSFQWRENANPDLRVRKSGCQRPQWDNRTAPYYSRLQKHDKSKQWRREGNGLLQNYYIIALNTWPMTEEQYLQVVSSCGPAALSSAFKLYISGT